MDSEACVERLKKIPWIRFDRSNSQSQWFVVDGIGILVFCGECETAKRNLISIVSIFVNQDSYKFLEDIFLDPTNPTPPELALFELEYGVEYPLLKYLKEIEDGKCS